MYPPGGAGPPVPSHSLPSLPNAISPFPGFHPSGHYTSAPTLSVDSSTSHYLMLPTTPERPSRSGRGSAPLSPLTPSSDEGGASTFEATPSPDAFGGRTKAISLSGANSTLSAHNHSLHAPLSGMPRSPTRSEFSHPYALDLHKRKRRGVKHVDDDVSDAERRVGGQSDVKEYLARRGRRNGVASTPEQRAGSRESYIASAGFRSRAGSCNDLSNYTDDSLYHLSTSPALPLSRSMDNRHGFPDLFTANAVAAAVAASAAHDGYAGNVLCEANEDEGLFEERLRAFSVKD